MEEALNNLQEEREPRLVLDETVEEVQPEAISIVDEENTLFSQALANESLSRTNDLESLTETRRLAEGLSAVQKFDQNLLVSYLSAKKGQNERLFSEQSPEDLASQLMKVETEIIEPMLKQAEAKGKSEEEIEKLAVGAREAFYGMILSGRLSAEKIKEILDGNIFFYDNPGEEIYDSEHRAIPNIAAYLQSDGQKFNIFIYSSLFENKTEDIAFLFRHEFSHAAALSIWKEAYIQFLEAAKNPHSNLEKFADTPELQQVLYLVANPRLGKHFFKEAISKTLIALESETDPEKIQYLRLHAAKEIVADLTAHFLEGSRSSDVFTDLRMRYFSSRPEELMQKIFELENVNNMDELYSRYGLSRASTPSELMEKMSKSLPLMGLFGLSKVWQDALTKRFADQGRDLERPVEKVTDIRLLNNYDLMDDIPHTPRWQAEDPETNINHEQKSTAAVFVDIWNLFIGNKPK